MTRKRNTPALLELIRERRQSRDDDSPTADPSSESIHDQPAITPPTASPSPTAPAQTTTPGFFRRILRIPTGFVVVYLGATVVLLIVAYSIGYGIGKNKGHDEMMPGFTQTPTNDPARTNPTNSDNQPIRPNTTTRNDTSNTNPSNETSEAGLFPPAGGSNPPTAEAQNQPTEPYRLDQDSRRIGLNYIRIEQFPPTEAIHVAEFLAANGIDVMVLPTNDGSLREVITRNGISRDSYSTEGTALIRRLRQLGRIWESQHNGSKDFDSLYGDLHEG